MTTSLIDIKFLVLLDGHFYPEEDIAANIQDFKQAAQKKKLDLLTMDGAISIVHCYEELLGIEYWDAVNQIFVLPHKLLKGEKTHQYLAYQSTWLRFTPKGKMLEYELSSHSKSRPVIKRRLVSLNDFIRSWTLMRLRLFKFEAFLGSTSAQKALLAWKGSEFGNEAVIDIVGEKNINNILNNEITKVLSLQPPSSGKIFY